MKISQQSMIVTQSLNFFLNASGRFDRNATRLGQTIIGAIHVAKTGNHALYIREITCTGTLNIYPMSLLRRPSFLAIYEIHNPHEQGST